MYVVNDIEFLVRLLHYKILGHLTCCCSIGISEVRLLDYTLKIRQEISKCSEIEIISVDNDFNSWMFDKRQYLSISDLSTVYIAMNGNNSILVITPEDELLIKQTKAYNLGHVRVDAFVGKIIKDEKVIKLYNLIKVA